MGIIRLLIYMKKDLKQDYNKMSFKMVKVIIMSFQKLIKELLMYYLLENEYVNLINFNQSNI